MNADKFLALKDLSKYLGLLLIVFLESHIERPAVRTIEISRRFKILEGMSVHIKE